jgi:RNA polymerase sigma-70 factor (sigma-E family)
VGKVLVQDRFTEFVNQRSHAMLRTAYALCGNQHDAEDLVQTALAKAFVRWARIDGQPEPYVRRIIYRDFVSAWRWRRRRPEVVVAAAPDRPGAGDHSSATVERLALVEALRRIPPRQRVVLVLRYLEDMSERDVAELLGCSTSTVSSQATRALGRLRKELATPPSDHRTAINQMTSLERSA